MDKTIADAIRRAAPTINAIPPAYLDVPAAGLYSTLGERMIRRLIAERRITFHKVGRHVRIARSDLDALLASGRVEAQR